MSRAQHWDKIYDAKDYDEVSWFTPHLEVSLRLIESAALDPAKARVIDVGGGRSTLVDDLLARGYQNLTVLDISAAAIEQTKERLGDKAASVT
ncbi:MAG TPA: class I SAM-dependent methyltransferase [Pyrinomonadaceae bacterium]|jgi:ubiquinone/menaquinone biosynthesis C-methylase UbiE